MQIAEHVLGRIAATPMVTDPWNYLNVSEIFPTQFYTRMLANLPWLSEMRPLSWKTRNRHVLDLHDEGKDNLNAPPFWQELDKELAEPLLPSP